MHTGDVNISVFKSWCISTQLVSYKEELELLKTESSLRLTGWILIDPKWPVHSKSLLVET